MTLISWPSTEGNQCLCIVSSWVISGSVVLCGITEIGNEQIFSWWSSLLGLYQNGKGKASASSQAMSVYNDGFSFTSCTPSAQLYSLDCHSYLEKVVLPRKGANMSSALDCSVNISNQFASSGREEIVCCLSVSTFCYFSQKGLEPMLKIRCCGSH